MQRRDSGRLDQKWLLSGLPSRAYGQFSPLVDPVVCVSLGNGLGGVRSKLATGNLEIDYLRKKALKLIYRDLLKNPVSYIQQLEF